MGTGGGLARLVVAEALTKKGPGGPNAYAVVRGNTCKQEEGPGLHFFIPES